MGMSSGVWGWARRGFAGIGLIALLATAGPALADTITLQPQKVAYAVDGGSVVHPVIDGQFDSVFPSSSNVYVWRQSQNQNGIQTEYRTGVDFQLPSVIMLPGTTINSAKIRTPVTSESVATADSITVNAIPGSDAPFVTTDFQVVSPVGSLPIQTSASWGSTYPYWPAYHDFEVGAAVQTLVGASNGHASFTFSIANWNTLLVWGAGLSLTIDYTPPSGTAPTLNILAPATGLTVLQGDPVTFQATASDAEDGPLDAAIQWTSSQDGLLGSGATLTTSTLFAGTHVINATVKDSNGNTVSTAITVVVKPTTNTPPTITMLAPADGSTFVQGSTINFEANASDAEDGNRTQSIQWTSSINGPIGTGGAFSTAALSVGTHIITATVQDSSGNTVSSTITVVVKAKTNTPPTITVLAPTQGATFVQGTAINFQATASDAEDGDRTASIQWTSNINGLIGTGGSFSTTGLSVGSHQIIATAYDTAGASASYLVNIVVQARTNTAPVVTIISPTNGASLTAGVSFTVSGTANDAEQGNMSSSLQWILDGVTTIATGASANVVIASTGAHTIMARVTDSGGLQGQQVINVNVTNAPPPSSYYCSVGGSNSTFEWIAGVQSGAINNASGSSGYHDYSAVQFNMTSGSGNSIVLRPGFSGAAYVENWSVWIDLNHDYTFSPNELVFSGSSSSAVSTTFTIPAGVASGPTRMRVILSYTTGTQPCGSFMYGEAEDYTVNIQPPATPLPPSTATYCSSRGTTSTYDFIQQISMDGTVRATGNNSGYADFTSSAPIPLARGTNSLILTPGFLNVSHNEQWMVWIDFNRDGVFGNEDWVFGGGGTSTVSGTFTIPTTVQPEITRMRVQMKYPSASIPCETFTYGEVEDYAVQIH